MSDPAKYIVNAFDETEVLDEDGHVVAICPIDAGDGSLLPAKSHAELFALAGRMRVLLGDFVEMRYTIVDAMKCAEPRITAESRLHVFDLYDQANDILGQTAEMFME